MNFWLCTLYLEAWMSDSRDNPRMDPIHFVWKIFVFAKMDFTLAGPHIQAIQNFKSHVNYTLMWILRILGPIKFCKGPIKISNGPEKFWNVHVFEWDMGHWPILKAHHHLGLRLSLDSKMSDSKVVPYIILCLSSQGLSTDAIEIKPVTTRKLRRRPNDPIPLPEKRRKPSPDILDIFNHFLASHDLCGLIPRLFMVLSV